MDHIYRTIHPSTYVILNLLSFPLVAENASVLLRTVVLNCFQRDLYQLSCCLTVVIIIINVSVKQATIRHWPIIG